MFRSHLKPTIVLALLLLAAIATPGSASAKSCRNADLVPTSTNLKKVGRATTCLINVERKRHHRKTLRAHRQLERAAKMFSAEMVSEGFFAHVSPTGTTLRTRVKRGTSYLRGARKWALGENLGWGTGKLATPRRTVRNWMKSRPHRANLLSRRFRHIGIGVTVGSPLSTSGRSAATYTADFGRRG